MIRTSGLTTEIPNSGALKSRLFYVFFSTVSYFYLNTNTAFADPVRMPEKGMNVNWERGVKKSKMPCIWENYSSQVK